MAIKNNKKLIKLKLGNIGANGDTVATIDSETISVFGGIPGEVVLAEITEQTKTKRKRKKTFATVKQIVNSSRYRIKTPCNFYGFCTGCNWQHINYEYQLYLKQKLLHDELLKYFNKVKIKNIIRSENQFHYRNHGRFTIRRNGQIGFTNKVTKKFVGIDKCLIMNNKVNNHIQKLESEVGETTQMSIRVGVNTDSFLIQPKLNNSEISIETGQKWYQETLLDHNFRVASPSFFQVNTLQAEKMILLVSELLNLKPDEILVDAYAGVGVFASLLATKVRKVIAIEESQSAVDDYLQSDNSIDNLEFLLGKTENVLPLIDEDIDSVILDPPRLGCHPNVINSILIKKPTKLAYVSCDPESLARDLNLLVKGGYKIKNIQPIDMFPQTYHVESITILEIN